MKIQALKNCCSFLILILLLTGCTVSEKGNSPTNDKMTIEPYNLSDKESLLISKTGVGQIVYFLLNGTLKENEDLQFSVELLESGKFKEELLKTWDEPETIYEDNLISFGISDTGDEGQSLKLITGIPSGLATASYANKMTSSTFKKLIDGKVTLEKNKPVYLAAWIGTTKNVMPSVGSANGELPQGIDKAEIALLYKALWTDQEKK